MEARPPTLLSAAVGIVLMLASPLPALADSGDSGDTGDTSEPQDTSEPEDTEDSEWMGYASAAERAGEAGGAPSCDVSGRMAAFSVIAAIGAVALRRRYCSS